MYKREEVKELLNGYGAVISDDEQDSLTLYITDVCSHSAVTVEDLLDGTPPQPGRDTYRVRYQGVDRATETDTPANTATASTVSELENTIDAALDQLDPDHNAYCTPPYA